jgi:hypothetical protein
VPLGDVLRVDVRLQDTATGETLVQHAELGGGEDVGAIMHRSGIAVRDRLAARSR